MFQKAILLLTKGVTKVGTANAAPAGPAPPGQNYDQRQNEAT